MFEPVEIAASAFGLLAMTPANSILTDYWNSSTGSAVLPCRGEVAIITKDIDASEAGPAV